MSWLKRILTNTKKISNDILFTSLRNSCYRTSITKNERPVFTRLYPVKLIRPDGSSITINYHEPIAVIRLPFDLSQLSEADRKRRLLKRQMANKIDAKRLNENQEILSKDVEFDPRKYLNIKKE